jgi:hypothetical protein
MANNDKKLFLLVDFKLYKLLICDLIKYSIVNEEQAVKTYTHKILFIKLFPRHKTKLKI